MTAKRFKIDLDEEAITDNGEYCLSLYCFQNKGEKDVCDLLNELDERYVDEFSLRETLQQELQRVEKENEQLKETIKTQNFNYENAKGIIHSSGHQIQRLQDEIEQLKGGNQRLIKMLDNVANYMQKEHRDIPIDDFVEWWNDMATEWLEND